MAARSFHACSVPIFAALLHTAMAEKRDPAWMPSHRPVWPPIEMPQNADPLDVQRIQHGQHVLAQVIEAVGPRRGRAAAMAARVVADQPETPGERGHLRLPHLQRGAQRVAQDQCRRGGVAVHGDPEFATLRFQLDGAMSHVSSDHPRSPPATGSTVPVM
ncbi:RNA polymerase sigma factor RpoE [Alicycliphilus sp. B1]|nr:RNA polymerase sigma factor RpoE [Alicycliphilus sp. B1]